jgi:hypothetical protein
MLIGLIAKVLIRICKRLAAFNGKISFGTTLA